MVKTLKEDHDVRQPATERAEELLERVGHTAGIYDRHAPLALASICVLVRLFVLVSVLLKVLPMLSYRAEGLNPLQRPKHYPICLLRFILRTLQATTPKKSHRHVTSQH